MLRFSDLILQSSRDGGVFISVKNFVCMKWVDEVVEIKGMDPKYSWEIMGIYRAPNEDMLAIERSVRTQLTKPLSQRFELTPGGLE
jgi:hypothetical protein